MDLTKTPPRSPKSTAVLNCVTAARMADKGRAQLAGKIGEYKYGNDSGMDKATLAFLEVSVENFTTALKTCSDDASLTAWLQGHVQKTAQEIEEFNAARMAPPSTPERIAMFQERLAKLAPGRTDLKTLWDLTELDDRKSFGLV